MHFSPINPWRIMAFSSVIVIIVVVLIHYQDSIDHDDIAQLQPDTEVFYEDHTGSIDLYLVLVNHVDAEIIMLYNARGYTDSRPLTLRYSVFYDGWIRGYPPEDPR